MPIPVSIVITTYNRSRKCLRAVRSVLQQTYPHWECLIIDDGSTDDTVAQLTALALTDARIQVIPLASNQGQTYATNFAVSLCRYDWIALLDSDDYWHPERLARQLEQIERWGTRYGLYYCACHVRMGRWKRWHNPAVYEGALYDVERHTPVIGPTSSAIVAKAAWQAVGGLDPTMPSCKDWDCWIRISRYYDVKALNVPLVYYEINDDAISANLDKVMRGRLAIWQRHVGEPLPADRQSALYLQFGKFLLGRGFCLPARTYLQPAWSSDKSFSLAAYLLLTYLPDSLAMSLYTALICLKTSLMPPPGTPVVVSPQPELLER